MTSLTRSAIFGICAILLIAGSIIPQKSATAADGESVSLVDGQVLTESIFAKNITIPVGATVYWAGDITLSAEVLLNIEGQLRAQESGVAYNITLSGGSLVVTGNIIARNGANGFDSTGNADTVGGAGSAGGHISISWPALESFTLATGGMIRSGDGGRGGNANTTANATSPLAVSATGGQGAPGGDVSLNGASAFINGDIRVGDGGSGGSASTWTLESRTFHEEHWANSTGGAAGASGKLLLPSSYTILGLHQTGQLTGGRGGDGGSAISDGEVAMAASCGAAGYHSSNDLETRYGQSGCHGESRAATGANGADGIIAGGNGEQAIVAGGDGTTGGSGADGEVVASGCAVYVIPGWGGEGGHGGRASATGGNGGFGAYIGGRGGDATADAGNGGAGGKTGNGGRSPTICDAHYNNCSWQSYVRHCYRDAAGAGCGHTGTGGQGGESFGYYSAAGGGGTSVTGLTAGPGTATGTNGVHGPRGASGTYACSHSGSHSHY